MKADIIQDGRVSRFEWVATHGDDENFDVYDLDGDGEVTLDEFKQASMTQRRQGSKHKGGDSKINKGEWVALGGSAKGFESIDTDGDGFLDRAEMSQWCAKHSRVRAHRRNQGFPR